MAKPAASQAKQALTTGSTIGGYRLDGVLGRGGMGTVYKATQLSVGRDVALKVLHADRLQRSDAIERFLAEARRTAALHHYHLVTVHDAGLDGASGQCYYAMEYVHGRTLATVINQGGALDPSVTMTLAHQIAEGLAHAHRAGVIHRDLKPENILITQRGEAKITDLGLAVDRVGPGVSNNRRRLAIVGTPGWSAPEQVRNPERALAAADIFAFGCVVYAMATGAEPFDGETVIDLLVNVCTETPPLLDQIPADLRTIVEQCLAKDPANRPAHGVELVAALDAPSRTATINRSRRRTRRRR